MLSRAIYSGGDEIGRWSDRDDKKTSLKRQAQDFASYSKRPVKYDILKGPQSIRVVETKLTRRLKYHGWDRRFSRNLQ